MEPRVSILMANFNGARLLSDTMETIVSQTLRDIEIVVVDDGSTDGSLECLRGWAKRDPRVVVVPAEHAGLTISLNRAIAAARAPLIARHDVGDRSHPRRIEEQAEFLDTNVDHVVVGVQPEFIDPLGRVVYRSHLPESDAEMRGGFASVIGAAVAARTDVARRIGGYRAFFKYSQDVDFMFRMMEQGKIANLPFTRYAILDDRTGSISSTRCFAQVRYRDLACKFAEERRRRGTDPLDRGEEVPPPRDGSRFARFRLNTVNQLFRISARARFDGRLALAVASRLAGIALWPSQALPFAKAVAARGRQRWRRRRGG